MNYIGRRNARDILRSFSMQINKVISTKCILFTYICAGHIAIYYIVDFFGDI